MMYLKSSRHTFSKLKDHLAKTIIPKYKECKYC